MVKESRKTRMENDLRRVFQPTHLVIHNTSASHALHEDSNPESHYSIIIAAEKFKELSRVAGQRAIHEVLKPEFKDGLHAISIQIVR